MNTVEMLPFKIKLTPILYHQTGLKIDDIKSVAWTDRK